MCTIHCATGRTLSAGLSLPPSAARSDKKPLLRCEASAIIADRLQDMPMLARLSVQCVLLSSSDRRLCCLPRGIFGRQGTAPEHFTHHYGCHLSFIGATCVRSRRAARSRGIFTGNLGT